MEYWLRPATPADVDVIVELIQELASYERLSFEARPDPAALRRHLFGERPYAEVLLADSDEGPAGYALFFPSYSTFLTRPGIYLEDLFVRPHLRGLGIGASLLQALARLAVERGCGRLEWAVLDWNAPAIAFYQRLGARAMADWTTWRVDGNGLRYLAGLEPEVEPEPWAGLEAAEEAKTSE